MVRTLLAAHSISDRTPAARTRPAAGGLLRTNHDDLMIAYYGRWTAEKSVHGSNTPGSALDFRSDAGGPDEASRRRPPAHESRRSHDCLLRPVDCREKCAWFEHSWQRTRFQIGRRRPGRGQPQAASCARITTIS